MPTIPPAPSNTWTRAIGATALVAIWFLTGCARAMEPTASVVPSTTSGGLDSPGPSDAPRPSAAPSSAPPVHAPLELAASPAPLPAGSYTLAAFLPSVSLAVDGTWTSVNRFPDFFDVQQDVGSPDVIAVQVARPRSIIGADGARIAVGLPREAAATISENPGLTVVEQSASRMSGLTGRQITVENATGRFVGVLDVGAGTVSIDTGRRLWMGFFGTPEGLVVVMVGGSVATWDRALTMAEPVLESIRIGG